jgi:(E)-4-hydroxy-3-methylbut-2-enyl-diphosphate synthase
MSRLSPSSPPAYCASRFAYRRRPTREVAVGDVIVGGSQPIRVQSMTTPATTDVAATVEQISRLAEAGCEIVRVTVPTKQDADALPAIRAGMKARGLRVPLVADIHFSPGAALQAVEHVEKVRINPGNYADRKRFEVREYSDEEYAREIERIRERFQPLVDRARDLGVAMRIGTNQGSLSDRIVNRYGDTPEGMVESALEFVRLCEERGYRDIVLSMKSSNPQVMIRAYRLLAARLEEEGGDYPFHLGVTEAGSGRDGRIKSAIGIGALLADGLGDTIRVSLTEDPVEEIPVAFALAAPFGGSGARKEAGGLEDFPPESLDFYEFRRRSTRSARWGVLEAGAEAPPRVELRLPSLSAPVPETAAGGSEAAAEILVVPVSSSQEAEALDGLRHSGGALPSAGRSAAPMLAAEIDPDLLSPAALRDKADRVDLLCAPAGPLGRSEEAALAEARSAGLPLLLVSRAGGEGGLALRVDALLARARRALEHGLDVSLAFQPEVPGTTLVPAYRALAARLDAEGLDLPLVLRDAPGGGEDPLLAPPARLGSLLADGLGDAVGIEGLESPTEALLLAYDILQGTRRRISRVEYISCPSCGRTLFDLEEVTREIQSRTAHLKDVKIAIMGCIVNGPGEMADADFGYVGWGPEKVALFVGKDCVEKDIPAGEAPGRLVELIRREGRWREPPEAEREPGRPSSPGRA